MEEQIRTLAETGHSRTHAAQLLGIERRKFYDICKLLPGIAWPAKNQSITDKAGYEKRRGPKGKRNATR